VVSENLGSKQFFDGVAADVAARISEMKPHITDTSGIPLLTEIAYTEWAMVITRCMTEKWLPLDTLAILAKGLERKLKKGGTEEEVIKLPELPRDVSAGMVTDYFVEKVSKAVAELLHSSLADYTLASLVYEIMYPTVPYIKEVTTGRAWVEGKSKPQYIVKRYAQTEYISTVPRYVRPQVKQTYSGREIRTYRVAGLYAGPGLMRSLEARRIMNHLIYRYAQEKKTVDFIKNEYYKLAEIIKKAGVTPPKVPFKIKGARDLLGLEKDIDVHIHGHFKNRVLGPAIRKELKKSVIVVRSSFASKIIDSSEMLVPFGELGEFRQFKAGMLEQDRDLLITLDTSNPVAQLLLTNIEKEHTFWQHVQEARQPTHREEPLYRESLTQTYVEETLKRTGAKRVIEGSPVGGVNINDVRQAIEAFLKKFPARTRDLPERAVARAAENFVYNLLPKWLKELETGPIMTVDEVLVLTALGVKLKDIHWRYLVVVPTTTDSWLDETLRGVAYYLRVDIKELCRASDQRRIDYEEALLSSLRDIVVGFVDDAVRGVFEREEGVRIEWNRLNGAIVDLVKALGGFGGQTFVDIMTAVKNLKEAVGGGRLRGITVPVVSETAHQIYANILEPWLREVQEGMAEMQSKSPPPLPQEIGALRRWGRFICKTLNITQPPFLGELQALRLKEGITASFERINKYARWALVEHIVTERVLEEFRGGYWTLTRKAAADYLRQIRHNRDAVQLFRSGLERGIIRILPRGIGDVTRAIPPLKTTFKQYERIKVTYGVTILDDVLNATFRMLYHVWKDTYFAEEAQEYLNKYLMRPKFETTARIPVYTPDLYGRPRSGVVDELYRVAQVLNTVAKGSARDFIVQMYGLSRLANRIDTFVNGSVYSIAAYLMNRLLGKYIMAPMSRVLDTNNMYVDRILHILFGHLFGHEVFWSSTTFTNLYSIRVPQVVHLKKLLEVDLKKVNIDMRSFGLDPFWQDMVD